MNERERFIDIMHVITICERGRGRGEGRGNVCARNKQKRAPWARAPPKLNHAKSVKCDVQIDDHSSESFLADSGFWFRLSIILLNSKSSQLYNSRNCHCPDPRLGFQNN